MDRRCRGILGYRLGADACEQRHRAAVDGADQVRGGVDVSGELFDPGEHAPAMIVRAFDERPCGVAWRDPLLA
jgi:hypothetical protein